MKKALYKDILREIMSTKGRFISLILIVALGVAFYAGIRATAPDMKKTLDTYMDISEEMDIRVVSTMGLTEDDLEAVRQVEGVACAEASYTYDAFIINNRKKLVMHFISRPETLNQPEIIEGTDISQNSECLMDADFAAAYGYRSGDIIEITAPSSDEDTGLSRYTFTIAGLVTSPDYFTSARGTASIGNGAVDGFIYLDTSVFTAEVYSGIYACVEGGKDLTAFSAAYEDKVSVVRDNIEAIVQEREEVRHNDITGEAKEKLAEGEADYEEAKTAAESELADGQIQLDDAQTALTDAAVQIADNEKKLTDGAQQIKEGTATLDANEAKLKSGLEAWNQGKAELEAKQSEVNIQRETLNTSKAELETADQTCSDGIAQAQAQQAAMEVQLAQLSQQKEALLADPVTNAEALAEIEGQITALTTGLDTVKGTISTLESQLAEIQTGLAKVEAGMTELEAGQSALDAGRAELDAKKTEIDSGFQSIDAGRQTLVDKQAEIDDGWGQLLSAKEELANGQTDYDTAAADYAQGKQEAEDKLAEAADELETARADIAAIAYPQWYVLDRNATAGYAEYGMNAERIGDIGKIFPVIFFLVAALMSLTTMTRMVESQRIQIGGLKALGYSNFDISKKFVIYALLAGSLGTGIGLAFGLKFLPWLIITEYKMSYPHIGTVLTPFNIEHACVAAAAAIGCVVGAAFAACYKETFASAASLMRPESPKPGKKIFLERLGFIWKHMRFTEKVSMRNLFRYKKRLFMTVAGIAGCTALIVFGFGLIDSISGIVQTQYGDIEHYDMSVSLEDNVSAEELRSLEAAVSAEKNVTSSMPVRSMNIDIEGSGGTTYMAYLRVPEKPEDYGDFVTLMARKSGEVCSLAEEGIVISEKLAELLGVQSGDEITLEDDGREKIAVISAVCENYILSYIYMSPTYYEQIFGSRPVYNTWQLISPGMTAAEEREIAETLLAEPAVSGAALTADDYEDYDSMLGNLDVITAVIVIAAGLLAFIVLYNLNNINITERRRELATLKVLGFYNIETAEYIYRENIVLTIIGTGVGLWFGYVLHALILKTVETDTLMFIRQVNARGFVYGAVLTVVFAIVVNITMYYKLTKIDMVESLKSVE